MIKIKKIISLITLFTVIQLALVACNSDATTVSGELTGSLEPQPLPTRTKIVLTHSTLNEVFGQVLLADALGELEKENIEVEFVNLSSDESLPALINGQVDVVLGLLGLPFFNAIDQGASIKMVLNAGGSPSKQGLWVRKELMSGLPESLKGKTIATSYYWGQPSMLMVKEYLTEHGMGVNDVELVVLPPGENGPTLDVGGVDAAWLTSPSYKIVEESGNAEWVVGYEPEQFSFGYIFGSRLLEDEPEVGQAFVRALIRTTESYLQGDYKSDAEVASVMSETLGVTIDELNITESIPFEILNRNDFNQRMDYFLRAQEMWIEVGDLLLYDKPIPTEEYIDWSFVERILAENNL